MNSELRFSEVDLTEVDLGAGVFAAFTNRHGGISSTPYLSLNLGPNVNDDPAAVAVNRKLVAERVGAPIVFSSQVHGADIIELDDAAAATWLAAEPPVTAGEADALLTASTAVGLGVLVADCVPVMLVGGIETPEKMPTMVATAHAGRRGVELNVIAAIVNKMREQGATWIKAAIGPAICGDCYEVPAEMRAEVAAQELAAWSETRTGTPGLNLPAAVADQLGRVGAEVAYQSPYCTLEHPDYFSHRAATSSPNGGSPQTTGRQAGVIRLLSHP